MNKNSNTKTISERDSFLLFYLGQLLVQRCDCCGLSAEQNYEVCKELLEQAYEDISEGVVMDYIHLTDWCINHPGTIDTTIERVDRSYEEELDYEP